ncbi:MAG TPA: YceI family protein [Polyangiaceae bacterium]|nr:YceI family protein [Polyangiaceae bacterium]
MPSYDATSAECFIFTFKEGLLSPVAHDLRLKVTRFSLQVDDARTMVSATFDAASLIVDTPMKDGAENPGALSAADKDKIAAQIRDEVLHARKYPEVAFRSRSLSQRPDGGYDFAGDLTLHGTTLPLNGCTRLNDRRQIVELSLHQPDFGITPYKAMLGTLKIQPTVRVLLTL